jgi:hypothetical protein
MIRMKAMKKHYEYFNQVKIENVKIRKNFDTNVCAKMML